MQRIYAPQINESLYYYWTVFYSQIILHCYSCYSLWMQTFVDKLICYSQYCNQLPKSSPLRLKKKILPDFFIPILHLIKCFKLSLKYGFCIHMLKHVALVCVFITEWLSIVWMYYSLSIHLLMDSWGCAPQHVWRALSGLVGGKQGRLRSPGYATRRGTARTFAVISSTNTPVRLSALPQVFAAEWTNHESVRLCLRAGNAECQCGHSAVWCWYP